MNFFWKYLIITVVIQLASFHALAASDPIMSPEGQIAALATSLERATTLEEQGEPDKALEELKLLLPLVRAQGTTGQLIDTLNHLGALQIHDPEGSPTMNRVIRALHALPENQSYEYLKEALALARGVEDLPRMASILNNMGTFHLVRKQYDATYYRESIQLARRSGTNVILAAAMVNSARQAVETGDSEAKDILDAAYTFISSRPESRDNCLALIGIGRLYQTLARQATGEKVTLRQKGVNNLAYAEQMAVALNDIRMQSLALGYQGELAGEMKQAEIALGLTRRALFAAQSINAPDLLYQWQWQLGRLFLDGQQNEAALAAYRQAVSSLQIVRNSIKPESSGSVISFRDMVEPVYRDLVTLLLQESDKSPTPETRQQRLAEIRTIVEGLRSAELQDYMMDSCIGVTGRDDYFRTGPMIRTAVIYLITLPTRLEILATLPTGIKRFTSPVDAAALSEEAQQFARLLSNRSDGYLAVARKLYDTVIRPMEAELTAADIQHLVIIPDGTLRSIPMAALHDGTQFLLDRFTVSTTQGIQLVNPAPRTMRAGAELLMAGITSSRYGLPALPNVREEFDGLSKLYNGKTLLDGEFKITDLKREIDRQPYTYIHLATHGEFAGDMHNMFLLAYDGLINFAQLDNYIKVTKYRSEPLELLTLSACKTAVGDERASLGLAGIAVKAGAKSTVATLWEIDDRATSELMIDFYRELKESSDGKGKALQRAQQKLKLKWQHPYYWSPFILIGNWM